jgi:predicted GIY-YIG superfamily endonuclease
MHTIYALIDPRNNQVRYVGITQDMYSRFIEHLRCTGQNARKDAWIQELKELNEMVAMIKLEAVETAVEAHEREAYWIHHYLHLGAQLLNLSLPEPSYMKPLAVRKRIIQSHRDARLEIFDVSSSDVDAVRELHSQGYSQSEIILKIWKAPKGGTQRYREARERYQQIIMQLNGEEA